MTEEIKIWPFNGYAPGNYMNKCSCCGNMMTGVDKLCFVCLYCAMKGANEFMENSRSEIEALKKEVEKLKGALEQIRGGAAPFTYHEHISWIDTARGIANSALL